MRGRLAACIRTGIYVCLAWLPAACPAQAPGKTLTAELHDAPLAQVLALLAQSSGQDFRFDGDVRTERRMSIFLKQSPVETALYYTLLANELEQQALDAHTVRIRPSADAGEHGPGTVLIATPSLLIDMRNDDAGAARKTRARATENAAATPDNLAGGTLLGWKLRSRSRVGSNFSLQLTLRAEQPVASLPLTIAFDGKALEVLRVEQGDFLPANRADSTFSSQVDPQGSIVLRAARTDGAAAGTVATITFRAVAEAAARIQVVAAGAKSATGAELAVAVPPLHLVQIQP